MDTVDFFNIDIQQTDWATASEQLTEVRYRVFVDEQQVPRDMEVDDADPAAAHWLAYSPDKEPIATARMEASGKVGRVCVVKEQRGKGVGAALMRRIIRHATRQNLEQLTLSSQLDAMAFYEGLGFISYGDEFMDAGIPHKAMRLPLGTPHAKPHLPTVSDDDRQRQPVENAEEFRTHAIKLIAGAERTVRIFTHDMDPLIYNDGAYCDSIYRLATAHPHSEIRILVRDNRIIKTRTVALAELTHKLSSRIAIRLLSKQFDLLQNDFLIQDHKGMLCKQDQERYQGYSVNHAPAEARDLAVDFDLWWEHGQLDPELRHLHI